MKSVGSIIIGQAAQDGEKGTSVTNVVRYYLSTFVSSGVTTSTPGWTTSVQTMTLTNKYLWTYDKTYLSDGTTSSTTPAISGVYGDSGYTYRPRGLYANGNTYVFNTEYRDVIYYEFSGTAYAFRVRTQGLSVTAAPASSSGDSNWEAANELKFIATDLLLSRQIRADEIDVDNLTVKNVEVKDSNGNVTTKINGATGELYSKKAKFEGAEVQGKMVTLANGNRIEISPTTNSITMYNQNNKEVGKLSFFSEEWNGSTNYMPRLRLRTYHDNNIVSESSITPGLINTSLEVGGNTYDCFISPQGGISFVRNGQQTKNYPAS